MKHAARFSRRNLLQGTLAAAFARVGAIPLGAAGSSPQDGTDRPTSTALALAHLLNRTQFGDLPPLAVEHAKIIIASTLASAASGSIIESARIIRELAKERGGKGEAAVWFDAARLPVADAARVNATLSD